MSGAPNLPGQAAWGAGYAGLPPTPEMTMGQVLDRIFRLLRSHLRLYLGIAAVPAAAMLCMVIAVGGAVALAVLPDIRAHRGALDFHFFLWLAPLILVLYIGVFIVYALYAAASAYAVVRTHRGEAVTAAQAWALARERAGSFIWLMFLLVLIVAGPAYLLFGACGGLMLWISSGAKGGAPPLELLALIPLFVILILGSYAYMVLMFLRYCLAFAASAMENLPAVQAIQRSVALSRGARGRIFVVLLVTYAAIYIVILACEMVLFSGGAIGVLAASGLHLNLHSPALLFLGLPLAILIALVFFLIVVALPYTAYSAALGVLYCDQKFRFDVAAASIDGRGSA